MSIENTTARRNEIYIAIRIPALRETVEEVQGQARPEDLAARAGILEALKKEGYEVIATGGGKYADAWVRKVLAPETGSVRSCEICGAKVRNQNPKTTTCDSICTAAKHANRTRQQQIEWEMANDQYDDQEGEPTCPSCGGEGMMEYLDAGPSAWGEDCPSEENHMVPCPNCRGSGLMKDATSC